MLDADLAALYGVPTKALNQAVARNRNRFPGDFMFQLELEEARPLRSQSVTLERGRGRHQKYLPHAFTEQGVAMLSSVLRSPQAVAVNIEIMRAFVELRRALTETAELARKLDGLERTVFSRLSRGQVRRRWWPKVTVTVMPPVRLTVDPALKGKARRQAAGAALYGIMSDLVFRTADIDRGLMAALIEAGERHGWGRNALEDPVGGRLSYSRLVMGANVLGRKLMPLAPVGGRIGVMLPNANGAAVTPSWVSQSSSMMMAS